MLWERKLKKTLYTLNINNYEPEVTAITYPLMKHYAEKCGADFYVIENRKWPDKTPIYEKFQVYDLMIERQDDWSIFIDSDALINPDMFDVTMHLKKDTVAHHGHDMATNRWKYDRIFMRDGRHIGSCTWFVVCSDWTRELWKLPDDQTYEEALENIYPTVNELNTVVVKEHLFDDYTLSRNIAKYGFKFTTVIDICKQLGIGWQPGNPGFFWHQYTIPTELKPVKFREVLKAWQLQRRVA